MYITPVDGALMENALPKRAERSHGLFAWGMPRLRARRYVLALAETGFVFVGLPLLAMNSAGGLTIPLITTAGGAKMGKTAEGAVWLHAEHLSAFGFWQFWRNTSDADVPRFLRLFTELPMNEVARLSGLKGAELNEAKKILADEVTTLARGREAAARAAATAAETFEKGGAGADLPRVALSAADLADGLSAPQLFVRAGLAASGKEAKRLIQEGGARLNDAPLTDPARMFSAEDFASGEVKLSAGKKRHALASLA